MARPRTRDRALADELLRSTVAAVDAGEPITTRGVARLAGTNVAALDQLFGGKAGLLRSVALVGFDRLAAAFDGVEPPAGGEGGVPALVMDRVMGVAIAHREFVRRHPHLHDLMLSVPVRAGDAHEPGDLDGAIACRDLVVAAVRPLVGGPDRVAHDAAVGLVALLEGLAVQERRGLLGADRTRRDQLWDSAVRTYLTGLSSVGVVDGPG